MSQHPDTIRDSSLSPRAEPSASKPLSASALPVAGRRWLAVLVDHALADAWRTADDFLRHFPVEILMTRLKGAPDLRAALLVRATGMDERIVRRKSLALASEDLRLALEEGVIHGDHILELLTPEDRVRYLDVQRLWGFLAEEAFWKLDDTAGETQRRAVRARLVFTLEQAVAERVLSWRGLLDALGYDAIADALAPSQLRSLARFALARGRQGLVLSERALLEVLPLETLVAALPLERIWQEVVVRRVAIPCGFVRTDRESGTVAEKPANALPEPPARGLSFAAGRASANGSHWERSPPPRRRGSGAPSSAPSSRPPAPSAPPPAPASRSAAPASRSAAPASRPAAPAASLSELPPPEPSFPPPPYAVPPGPVPQELSVELPLEDLPPLFGEPSPPVAPAVSLAPEADDSERRRLVAHLSDIERLPAGYGEMATPVLRSIRNMYAMLPGATDDIQRRNVIRQSFADEQQLREGLLGLLELMDSSVDTSDPLIRGAKVEPLIKILLFEEQRRAEAESPEGGQRRSTPPR